MNLLRNKKQCTKILVMRLSEGMSVVFFLLSNTIEETMLGFAFPKLFEDFIEAI